MTKKKLVEIQDVCIPETEEATRQRCVASSISGDTVTVGLCHPQGLQFLLDDGKRRVKLNGNAVNLRGLPKGILPDGGFGLTMIPKADWEAIRAKYAGFTDKLIKNGVLFAREKRADTLAEANEKAEVRHGREPVKVDGDDRTTQSKPFKADERA